jgi:molybdopterin synthase sulfur carrier subunit
MGACRVSIPGPLLSYTGQRQVAAAGPTLGAVLKDLDSQFPGIRFRMVDEQDRVRPHMRIFVNGVQVFDLGQALGAADTVHIVQALSGG